MNPDTLDIDGLLERMTAAGELPCVIDASSTQHTYLELVHAVKAWCSLCEEHDVVAGDVVGLRADFSFSSIAALLALLKTRCVVALVPKDVRALPDYLASARVQYLLTIAEQNSVAPEGQRREEITWTNHAARATHPLLDTLRAAKHPGMVIFTSGSSGQPKAVLHDHTRFCTKFAAKGKALNTLAFLLFDHIAGQDTLHYTLSAGGTLVLTTNRRPGAVCKLIDRHRVEVLPTSPSFLNLLTLSGEVLSHDLSSLQFITYGSEPMSCAVLARVVEALPKVKVVQKYGTSEIGAPRAKPKAKDSLWLEFDRRGVETKIVDGILWVRSPNAMLGYLNHPSPIDADGWLCTGDVVERDGDWILIKGRASDIINVGGEKVFPSEVEAVIVSSPLVVDAVVSGDRNPLLGEVVKATLNLAPGVALKDAEKAIRKLCRKHLAPHKVPMKFVLSEQSLVTARQKKVRA